MDTRSESENQPAGDALVDIHFCGSTPLLWKVSDMKRCRSLGVTGALVGSLARQPRQNVRLGRPLELLQEEALLLEETSTGVASLHTQVSHYTTTATDIYLSIYLSIYLFVCLFVCLFIGHPVTVTKITAVIPLTMV